MAATVVDGLGLAPGFRLTSNSTLMGVTLANNYDVDYSTYGAIRCEGDSLRIINCVITGSLCGGIYAGYEGNAIEVSGCRITQCATNGIYIGAGDLTLANSVICGNTGQGICMSNGRTASILGSTIANNGNGTGLYGLTAAVVRNSVIWEPTAFDFGYQQMDATYSVFRNSVPGTGNLSIDPKVRSDGHLRSDSPCRNAGDPTYTAPAGQQDIDGEARVAGGRVDIGADEFADVDADGLPDWWEVKYFGSTTAGDPAGDPDNDSLTNLEEYNRSTHPLQASPGYKYYVDPVNGNDSSDGQAAELRRHPWTQEDRAGGHRCRPG